MTDDATAQRAIAAVWEAINARLARVSEALAAVLDHLDLLERRSADLDRHDRTGA